MPAWILARPLLSLAMLAAIIFAAWALWWTITSRPRAEARLGKNTTEAALESGRDAVAAQGEQSRAEAAIDRTTQENAREIRNAEGADAPVADAAHAAGLRSLCRRAANRGRPECLQHPPAP